MSAALDSRDFQGETWDRLRQHLETELAKLRAANDNETLDAVQTALLRGEIRRVKNLLALPARPGKPPPITLMGNEDRKFLA